MLDVLMVIYRPRLDELAQCLAALRREAAAVPGLRVRLWHNDGGPTTTPGLQTLYAGELAAGLALELAADTGANLGFGPAINELLALTRSDCVLVLNQDAIPEPGSIALLCETARADRHEVAAWEMRQIPFEHPKDYDPVTQETEWVSGAAVLLRTSAVKAVGGFEPKIFMYGEDVELSWRLRCAGFRLRYVPRAAVVHHTYAQANEVKPLQVLEGIYSNLSNRARYSGHRRMLQGVSMAIAEMMIPQPFPGRRKGIAGALVKFARNYRYFWNTHQSAAGFEPRFAGWGYEVRREGAFHPFLAVSQQRSPKPLVSILIRTHRRAAFLRQALTSVLHQTHRPIEAVVVEDGSDEGESVCEEFRGRLDVRYFRIHPGRGRSVAGNFALAQARGEWICFLDDDDLLFADHVEVLLQTAQQHQLKGAYGLSWRTHTRVVDEQAGVVEEVARDIYPDEAFSRMVLWHHNFLPIQSVLFHRSLYERHGGFAEDMEQLEDWNLWTRYTIDTDFVQVRKVTSKYRVPAAVHVSAQRQARLDEAYRDAVARQETMVFDANPALVRQLAQEYARQNALIHVGRDQIRRSFARWPLLRRLFALRSLLRVRRREGRSGPRPERARSIAARNGRAGSRWTNSLISSS
ncbi:MAG: glycosyltransferase family 2 protein [Ramlibacter sp.]